MSEINSGQIEMRAKLILTMNIVDKGQNKGQLRDFSLFMKNLGFQW